MTTTNAELHQASINALTGNVLLTWVLTYPRIILPEIGTHRMLSKSTSSSRAIPARKQRQRVWEDPFVPEYIGANRKGMQAGDELLGWRRWLAVKLWRGARIPALCAHCAFEKLGVHKQITNRLIEPFLWTRQVVSATEWDNFFLLRDHQDAEPHFHKLAAEMHRKALSAKQLLRHMMDHGPAEQYCSTLGLCQVLEPGEWHLPFILNKERDMPLEVLKKVSAARCARVSYTLPETETLSTVERDLELFDRLAGHNPKHLSPLEHQATPLERSERCGNFIGWKQFRKEIFGESGILI